MALKQVKNKIQATKKTGQVTKAMEAVSAVKMRKSQEKALKGRPYVRSALRILARLAETRDGLTHPFIQPRNSGRKLLIIVTSDKGLAGNVNSAVLKKADELLVSGESVDTICVGKKAVDYAVRMKLESLGDYTNVSDDVALNDVVEIANTVFSEFKNPKYVSVEVVYQNFLSTFEQAATHRRILPLDPAELEYIMSGIKPKTGKYSDEAVADSAVIDYVIEPAVETVLETLIPQLVQIIIYHALIENKASEHSARMVAMKNATDKTKEVVKNLTILYNKERQAAITAEVSEITGGIEALKT